MAPRLDRCPVEHIPSNDEGSGAGPAQCPVSSVNEWADQILHALAMCDRISYDWCRVSQAQFS